MLNRNTITNVCAVVIFNLQPIALGNKKTKIKINNDFKVIKIPPNINVTINKLLIKIWLISIKE